MITDFPNGKKLIIGCIHLLPMPNTPFYTSGDFERSLEKAVKDAAALKNGGADGCIIQPVDRVYTNTDDTDYVRVACMAVVGQEVRRVVGPRLQGRRTDHVELHHPVSGSCKGLRRGLHPLLGAGRPFPLAVR